MTSQDDIEICNVTLIMNLASYSWSNQSKIGCLVSVNSINERNIDKAGP